MQSTLPFGAPGKAIEAKFGCKTSQRKRSSRAHPRRSGPHHRECEDGKRRGSASPKGEARRECAATLEQSDERGGRTTGGVGDSVGAVGRDRQIAEGVRVGRMQPEQRRKPGPKTGLSE